MGGETTYYYGFYYCPSFVGEFEKGVNCKVENFQPALWDDYTKSPKMDTTRGFATRDIHLVPLVMYLAIP